MLGSCLDASVYDKTLTMLRSLNLIAKSTGEQIARGDVLQVAGVRCP